LSPYYGNERRRRRRWRPGLVAAVLFVAAGVLIGMVAAVVLKL